MKNHKTILSFLRKFITRGKSIIALALFLFAFVTPVTNFAQSTNPVPVQFFYVPIPENDLLTTLQTVNAGNSTQAVNPIQTYISIAAIANNTVIYYDHWENGYDADISNPLNLYSAGNPGGTQIWGDGNPANGAPPGFPGDIINAGNVIILNNPVFTSNLLAIDYDGRDKIAASKTIAVVRSGWATGPNTLLAAANETSDTDNWGTNFVVPVGENMPTSFDNRLFVYTGLSIMAGPGGSNVQVDADANGSYETSFSLSEGQARLINGGVNVGAKILASRPVQVDLLTGDVGEEYETRFFNLTPTNLLYNEYYTPVSTASNVGTVVFLYNPNSSSMTVNYTTRTGSGGNTLSTSGITLSAGGYAKQLIPEGYGAKFASTNGATFHALSATDATGTSTNNGDNRTWDWGFTLVGQGALTPQVLIGLGLGRDPTSNTNLNENGNPVWVTPVGNGNSAVTVYADFDGDPSTGPNVDPNGNRYNVSVSLRELDRAFIYDNIDRDQTGMLVYTLTSGVKLAAAWGQDPDVASAAAPGFDMGTGVPPLPLFDAGKNGTLFQDNDGDGFISPGDIILYKIVINNISRAPVPDVLLFDNLPANTIYVPNSTFFKNAQGVTSQIFDDGSGTAFPLDGSGKYLDVSALPVGKSYEVTFKVTIKDFEDLQPGTTHIINTGYVSAVDSQIDINAETPIYGRIGDYIWNDVDKDGIQDPSETGIQGVTVNLYDGDGNLIATKVTDANGKYLFVGLLPGNYVVEVVKPSTYDFTIQNADSQGLNGSLNSDANVSTGRTGTITLAGGEPNKNIDAGLIPNGSIGDKVWDDTNNNGIQDPGENGIPGVTVKLYDCNDNLIAQTTTNSNGIYKFSNLAPGSYYVQFELPAGYAFTSPDQGTDDNLDSDANITDGKTICTTLALGQTITNLDAGLVPSGSIGDKVWNDANNNGIQDPGEAGIEGVVIRLYDCNGNFIKETTTDSNGNYTFANLPAGSYSVQFVKPTGYNFALPDQGADDNLDSDANTTDGKTICTTLALGQTITNLDAGLVPNGSIGDKVWNDLDKDGIQDPGETGIPGVVVNLYDCNDTLIATTTTDANGNYTFSNLAPGSYYVQFVKPAGYDFVLPDQGGDDNLDSDANVTDGKTICTTLALGQTITNLDAGLVPNGSIGDKVWNDTNNNGIQDPGENGIPGVTVNLYDCNDNPIAATITDANGNYAFANLPAGSYYVQFVKPAGYNFALLNQGSNDDLDSDANVSTGKTDCTTLALGQTITNLDAGLVPNGSIGDRVWNDLDKDGIQDPGEGGLSGIVIKLYNCDNTFVTQTTTDANGNYSFSNLVPGSYYVVFMLPNGFTFAPVNQGLNDNLDSDSNVSTGKTDCITLSPGDQITNLDAGMYEEKMADVRIEKSVSDNTPNCGDNIIYTIKVTNDGPDKARGIEATDLLPQGLVYVSSTTSQGTYDSNTGKWIVGDINSGSFATLTITVEVDCDQISGAYYDLGPAKDFNLFVIEDINQPSSDTQGRLAVGGNAYLANYSVGDQLPPNSGDVLIVGGTLTYISGAVYNGNVVYGVSTNLPQNSVSITGGTLRQDNPIDFAAAKAYLENLSTTLGGFTANGTVAMQWGGLNLTGTDPYLNVFAVNGSDLSNANNVSINAPNGSVVLVNISGTNVSWSGGLSVNGTAKENVLFNFYQATNLTLQGIDVTGSILAPFAALHFPSGVVNGQVIVKSMAGSGQFNAGQFNQCKFIGYIPYEKEVTNVASITFTLTDDPNSNNNSSSVKIKIAYTSPDPGDGNGGNNGGGNWQYVNGFAAGEIVYTMAYSNSAIYAGTWGGKIYKSTDQGQTWTRINNNMFVGFIWSLAVDSDNLIFAATEQGVYKYDGTNWTLTSLVGKDVHSVSIGKTLATKVLYAATWGDGLYKSTNLGITWTQINNGLGGYLAIQSVVATSANIAYAASFGGGVYVTINGGGLWTKLNVGYDFVWSVAAIPAINPFNTKIFAGTYGDGLYRSLNGGTTWSKVTNLNAPFIYSVVVDKTGKIYVASWTTGVFTSSDNGDTWTSLGMGGLGVSAILINPETNDVYLGTKEGKIFFSKSGGLTDVADNETSVPTKYELNQNYPNPFNPSTVIQFALPEAGRFTLRVYNILGQEIATLVDGELNSGIHKIGFDASRLSSGVYIYKLTGNKVNISRKMILTK